MTHPRALWTSDPRVLHHGEGLSQRSPRKSTGAKVADTSERNREIIELHRQGRTLQQIGDRFGISRERVRQIVVRAEAPRPTSRPRASGRSKAGGGERVRLRIGNLAKAVLVTGQAYQDPKDALNEFVSNAADEYVQGERRGERIRVVLRRKGRNPVIAVDDQGRGMDPDRLREVARNLFESTKVGDDRTLGEKAIGLLGFQQLGGRCEIVSRAADSEETWSLTLARGQADATLARERRRARTEPGTTVYLSQLDPEVLRMLTQRKVVDYLRRRRGPALARGDYEIEVVEGRSVELVTPEEPDGIRLAIPARPTLWGRIEFALYVAADVDTSRHLAVVGRAGTTIIDDLTELEELDHAPWTSGQLSGQVVFEALQQSAGRRAVLRDRDAFPVFRDALAAVESTVTKALERVRQEVDEATADRMSDTVRKLFGRVLKELADMENPMRTPLGSEAGTGALPLNGHGPGKGAPADDGSGTEGNGADGGAATGGPEDTADPRREGDDRNDEPTPDIGDLAPDGGGDRPSGATDPVRPQANRSRHLPTLVADPEPGPGRSRFDPGEGTVLYNDRHSDYLMVKDDEPSLLDYLATLVAKEYVVYNNPLSPADELAEEMVRMLVRVRRHLPRRR